VSLRFWITPQRNQLNSNDSAVRRSGAIFQLRFAGLARAVDAAENLSISFNAVPDNPAIAMRANWRQRVDGALETVEGVTLTGDDHFKRLVIFVFANLTCSHT
jgi:sigma54-dependent transcription regulator